MSKPAEIAGLIDEALNALGEGGGYGALASVSTSAATLRARRRENATAIV